MSEDVDVGLKVSLPISEVKAIEKSRSQMFRTKEEISQYVEPPLVPACERFWDLNIRTMASSANSKDVGTEAYIFIDYNSLSGENKQIAGKSAEIIENYDGKPAVYFTFPITNETTFEQVEKEATAFAGRFKKQKADWIPKFSLQQIREYYGGDPDNDEFGLEAFVEEGWYYDSEGQKFYLSEEHFKKANEKVIESQTSSVKK